MRLFYTLQQVTACTIGVECWCLRCLRVQTRSVTLSDRSRPSLSCRGGMDETTAPPVKLTIEQTASEVFDALSGSTTAEKLRTAVASSRVVVFGRSTCPFCIEVCRTFVELAVPFTYFMLDKMEQGAQIHEELKKLTGQRTVPYVYIHGQLVGGCDATKDLIASGEFDKKLGSWENGSSRATSGGDPTLIKLAGVDEDAPRVIGALLEFPNTVDNRIIRLVAVQVFFISLFLAIFAYKKHQSWHWVAVGLLVDFCLRFYGGASTSPLGSLAQLVAAVADLLLPLCGIKSGPIWGAGPPKQFAVSVGILFSTIIVVLQFTHQWQAATAFAATLCFFAGLEAFLNFCAGCWVFGYAIKFGIIPDTVYMVHINTLPETKYTWHDWVTRVHPPAPVRVVQHFPTSLRPGSKPTKVDLHYKTGKTDDWEQEDFDIIKHVKIGFFSPAMGVAAIPAMFKFMAMTPSFGTPTLVWQILTVLSLCFTSIFLFPYLLKIVLYPHKVYREWMHPVQSNAFSVPFMTLVVYAFLAEHYSRPFARVLFWAGAGPTMLVSIMLVGNWLATIRHEGHVNGAFQMAPIGNFIVAVVGPIVDYRYRDVCFMWFGFAAIMYITLFIFTFQRNVVGYIADPRQRMFAAIWFAAPAVMSIAWTVLTAPGGVWLMDGFAQTMFYVAFTLGLVVAWMAWKRFLWTDMFFMPMWAFGFPTAGLAWSAILYDATINTALSKVLAICLISLACIVAAVLTFRTLAGIARLKVFIPEHRWGPMAHLPLAQDSMRSMLHNLTSATEAYAANPSNSRLAERVIILWRSFTTVNTFYIKLKNEMCFPTIGSWFPGHQRPFVAQNMQMLDMQAKVDTLMAGLGAQSKVAASGVPVAAIIPDSMDGYPGSTPAEKIASAAAKNQLVVVGRSTCPFCIEITRTFSQMGLPYVYFQVDHLPNGAELHQSLKEATGQRTVPYVYVDGQMVGGCDATKALIASGELDKRLGGTANGGHHSEGADVAALQAHMHAFSDFAVKAFTDVEDHVRPVTRRYISGPVQKKLMNDCWDLAQPEEWFQAIPLVLQHLPMFGQRLTYIRAFLWAMPERCQQIGLMVALGSDPVSWYRLRKALPEIIPRGEAGWKHF